MKHFPRVQARGFWGRVDPPPFTYDLTSQKYFEAARRSGGLQNLDRLRGFETFDEDGMLDPGAALMLRGRRVWPATWNAKSNWSNSSVIEELPNPFGSGPALAYEIEGTPRTFTSSLTVGENQPFCFRAFLLKQEPIQTEEDEAQPRSIWGIAWGAGSRTWQLRIIDGSFEITRLSANWTAGKQADLDALEDIESPTEAEQEAIDELRGPRRVEDGGHVSFPDAIYDVIETPSLGEALEKVGGKFYEISIIPEPRGYLNVRLGNNAPVGVEVPDVLASRTTGQIYPGSPLSIFTSGQPFMWQTGEYSFSPKGSLRIGPLRNGYWVDSLGSALCQVFKDDSPAGTNATISQETYNSVTFGFRATATTSNPKYTPFLYGAVATIAAGARTGINDLAWDSSENLIDGMPGILDMVPSCEGGSNAAMRRQEWQVTMRDPAGAMLASLTDDNNCDALENRIIDLSAGASLGVQTPILTTGLVTSSQINDAARARYNTGGVLQLLRSWLLKTKTTLSLTIADGWAILDEDLMIDSPIGDGMRLGAYLRLILKNGGWSNAEIAGISASAGRILPMGGLGEAPCVRPEREEPRGDFLRGLIERYGLGWSLWINAAGVWQFSPRNSAIKTIGGHLANFVSTTDHNNMTYPGRFAVLSPLEHIRDSGDFYNYFRVEGWINPLTGQRLADEYIIWESIKKTSVLTSLTYLGRIKRYPTLRDDGLRTMDDVQYALRSLVALYGRSCRYLQFTSYFHVGLMPGDLITVDGLLCEVTRLSGGSMKSDRMQIVAMELG